MYWGSVRFFKHIILTCTLTMILIPTVLAVSFGKENQKYKQLISEYQNQIVDSPIPRVEYTDTDSNYEEILTGASIEYQTKYPDLYVEPGVFTEEASVKPVIYLTFDDGPSLNTVKVLDILKENNIKATFFVVNNNIAEHQELYKRIVDEGHTLGIHTYSHQYNKIYSSVDEYLDDFNKIFEKVYSLTGVKPTVFRFPGGSINSYNQQIYLELIAEMLRRGFTYYDWNVSSGDAGITYTPVAIQQAVINGIADKDKSIVLMHDSSNKAATVAALQNIIDYYKETHEFKALNNTVKPTVFTYKDNKISS